MTKMISRKKGNNIPFRFVVKIDRKFSISDGIFRTLPQNKKNKIRTKT